MNDTLRGKKRESLVRIVKKKIKTQQRGVKGIREDIERYI